MFKIFIDKFTNLTDEAGLSHKINDDLRKVKPLRISKSIISKDLGNHNNNITLDLKENNNSSIYFYVIRNFFLDNKPIVNNEPVKCKNLGTNNGFKRNWTVNI